MINIRKEAEFQLKQEGLTSSDHEKAKASSSSSQWLKVKDPRIVRVSRAFGGKDRHSKVCTIRGLRDRRVRLSVPTAIHLYDLQDRLGLNQPSKVIDWLLNAAKHEIDELPPLPISPGNFTLGYPSLVTCNNQVNTSREGSGQNTTWKYSPQSKQVLSGDQIMVNKENYWMRKSGEEENNNNNNDKQGSNSNIDCYGAHVLANNLLPARASHHPSFLGLLNTMPSLGYQWEPNSFEVNQTDHNIHSINVVPFTPSTLALSTGNSTPSHQILVCNPPGATQPYFPSHVAAAMEMNPRQINNHCQMLSSSNNSQNLVTNSLPASQHLMGHSGKPFSLGRVMTATPKVLFHSPNNGESHNSHKDQDFTSK